MGPVTSVPTVNVLHTVESKQARPDTPHSPEEVQNPDVNGAGADKHTVLNIPQQPKQLQGTSHVLDSSDQDQNAIPQTRVSPWPPYSYDASPGSIFTVNDKPITHVSNVVAIAGATITYGSPSTSVSGTPIALRPSVVIIGTGTIPLDQVTGAPSITILEGNKIRLLSDGISIAGTTIIPGAPAITMSGTPISVGDHVLVVGTSTISLPSQITGPRMATIDGMEVKLLPSGLSIAGTTITPGALQVTVSGKAVSLGEDALVIGASTVPLPSQMTVPPIATIGGIEVKVLPNGLSIASTTITPGASQITVSDKAVSLGEDALMIGTSTILLPTPIPTPAMTTLDGVAIQTLSNGLSIAGVTLTPGAYPVTVSGITISLGSSALMLGTNTIPYSLPSEPTLITSVGGQAITANPTAVVFAGTTLLAAASGVMLNGTLVSLDATGDLVIGSSTVSLQVSGVRASTLIMDTIGKAIGSALPSLTSAPSSGEGYIAMGSGNQNSDRPTTTGTTISSSANEARCLDDGIWLAVILVLIGCLSAQAWET